MDEEVVQQFSREFHLQLQPSTSKEDFRFAALVEEGNGFEAWRALCNRYIPRTPGTKRSILRAILNCSPAKELNQVEDLCRRYDELASNPLSED
eukprot:7933058-Lingulodinium_polyedra.AAC.1